MVTTRVDKVLDDGETEGSQYVATELLKSNFCPKVKLVRAPESRHDSTIVDVVQPCPWELPDYYDYM